MKRKLRHPYQRALITVIGLMGLALLALAISPGLSAVGGEPLVLAWISLGFLAFFWLVWMIAWLLGVWQLRRAAAFLTSDRPLVRWTYSTAEWQQMKEAIWQEESGDWKVQWGCLTVLLALSGLLSGVMIGLDEGGLQAVGVGLIGAILGGLAGFVIGAVVAGGNYWGARQAYQQKEPGQVALGPGEIYADGDYFKADGGMRRVRQVVIRPGSPAILELQLEFPPRPRMPLEEQWDIPLPAEYVEQVTEVLPLVIAQ